MGSQPDPAREARMGYQAGPARITGRAWAEGSAQGPARPSSNK